MANADTPSIIASYPSDRFFFEEDAFDADGKLKQSLELSLNKIGHNLHELDPVFRRISMSQKFKELSHDLGLVKPIVPQSMAILKQPKIGGLVVPHQDSTFLYTSPGSCIGMWWPLEDASLENGCLWAVPGSHKAGLKRRFKRNADGTGTLFEPAEKVEYSTEGGVPLEIKAGTLVLIHGALVHWSDANKSDKSRYAYSIHVVEGAEGFEYPRDNWLQRDTPFPVFD